MRRRLPILVTLLLTGAAPLAAQPAPASATGPSAELIALRDKELVAAGVSPAQLAAAENYFVKFASEKDPNNERERTHSCKDLSKLFHSADGVRLLRIGLPIQHKYQPFSLANQDMSSAVEKNRANGNADWACMYAYIQVYIDLIKSDPAAAQKAMGQADALYMIINGTVTAK